MQPNPLSSSPTIKVTNVTITDAKNGIVEVSVPNSQTNVPQGNYYFVFIVTDALNVREPVTIGTLTVLPLPS